MPFDDDGGGEIEEEEYSRRGAGTSLGNVHDMYRITISFWGMERLSVEHKSGPDGLGFR